ncbi:MAG: O-antigen ligase family protein [Pirellula sp.]
MQSFRLKKSVELIKMQTSHDFDTDSYHTCGDNNNQTSVLDTKKYGPTKYAIQIQSCPLPVIVFFISILAPSEFFFKLGTLSLPLYRVFLILFLPIATYRILNRKVKQSIFSDTCMLLSSIWVFISLSNTMGFANAVEPSGVWFVESFGAYIFARAFIRNRTEYIAAFSVLALVISILGFVGIFGSIWHFDPVDAFIRPAMGLPTIEYGNRLGMQRVSLMFFHPIHWGVFASSAFSFVVLSTTSSIKKLPLGIGIFLGCFSSLSSGALASISLQTILLVWNHLFWFSKNKWKLFLAALLVLYVGIDMLSNRDPFSVAFTYLTFSSHTAYWRSIIFEYGVAEVYRNPLLGIGFNEWIRPSYMKSGSMDNFWLVIAVRHGIPAFIFFGSVFIYTCIKGFSMSSTPANDSLMTSFVFALCATGVAGCAVHFWLALLVFFCFQLGLLPGLIDEDLDHQFEYSETSQS